MSASILPNGKQQFTNISGAPLVGGTVGMYVPGTLSPKPTWEDAGQTVLNTNPIVLDSRGQAIIYGIGSYRQIVKDSLGNLIWDEPVVAPLIPGSFPFVTPEMYGAVGDGITDDAVAFNAAFTAGAASGATILGSGVTYKINSTLSIDIAKTSFEGNGSTLDFTNLSASPGFSPFTSATDPNVMLALHRSHPFRNFRIIGPQLQFTAFSPIAATISGLPWIPGVTLENVVGNGWEVFYDINDGDFFHSASGCGLDSVTGLQSGWMYRSMGATNSGENMHVENPVVTNAVGFYLETTGNPNMTLNVYSASMDGTVYIATGGSTASPGTHGHSAQLKFFLPHWEANSYTDYLVWCSSSFLCYGGEQLLPAGPLPHVPFKCDATQLDPGIVLHDHLFVAGSDSTAFPGNHVCDGNGRFQMSVSGLGNTFIFSGAISNNRVPTYTWPTSTSLTSNWTGSPQYDNTDFPTGAVASCKLDATHLSATFATPCSPGQSLSAQAQVKVTSLGAGDKVSLIIAYVDVGNNQLSGGDELDLTSNLASYVSEVVVSQGIAPPGTVSAVFRVVYAPSAGGATVRFGLPEIQVL